MDISRALVVVGITLVVVILINVSIFVGLSRRNPGSSIEYLQKAAQRAKSPWKPEDDALSELSRLVKDIQEKDENPGQHQSDEKLS